VRVIADARLSKTFPLPCSLPDLGNPLPQPSAKNSDDPQEEKFKNNVALSKALFSLRRCSGSDVQEALLLSVRICP
jgi:hypothetical protein